MRGSFPAVTDVDDVVQESYVRIWRARLDQPIHSGKSFLFQIARRVALNFVRKRRNAPFVHDGTTAVTEVLDERPDARDALLLRERIELLADALMTLPPRCREITVMHKVHGLAQAEIAARLGLSERTIETQVRAGVARCHAYLQTRGLIPARVDEA